MLTGTPLQNNLQELYCMVSFVKPSLLGTVAEFRNRFENPISYGQHRDSSDYDVKLMKKRAHVLFNTLDKIVNRKDYAYFRSCLPEKKEYVLSVRLTTKQIELYHYYLEKRGFDKILDVKERIGKKLLSDFHHLSRIWTHPWAIMLKEEDKLKAAAAASKKKQGTVIENQDIGEVVNRRNSDEKSSTDAEVASERSEPLEDPDIDNHLDTLSKKYVTLRKKVMINIFLISIFFLLIEY